MPISEFDVVITNFEGTRFTAFYKKGINLKLSDGTTVINIYKPGTLKKNLNSDEYYKDAIIQLSGNDTNSFHYQDLLKLQNAIEKGIDFLNKENENLIDRNNCSYETVKKEPNQKKKTSAIKYVDLEIGGIYLDNKEKEWIFLGEADLYENNYKANRDGSSNGESRYIYSPNIDGLQNIGNNWFKSKNSLVCTIDSYASKKRFFQKVGQLEIDPTKSITFFDEFTFYAVYGNSVDDKSINEEKIKMIITERKEKVKADLEELNRKHIELLSKIMNSDEKANLSIEFKNNLASIKLISGNQIEEFDLNIDNNFYSSFFYPVMKIMVSKNLDNLDNIDKQEKNHDDNNDIIDYIVDSKNLTMIVKNIDSLTAYNIGVLIDNSILQYSNEEKRRGNI